MVCKKEGCVFEVDFSKSLEDVRARGWTRLWREKLQLLLSPHWWGSVARVC